MVILFKRGVFVLRIGYHWIKLYMGAGYGYYAQNGPRDYHSGTDCGQAFDLD